EISLHNRRSLTSNWLARPFFIHIYKLKLLSVWRLSVGLVKTRCCRAAADDEKRSASAGGNDILPDPSAVSQRDWQENCEAQKQYTSTRLHCLIERRRGINHHRPAHGRCDHGQNVFARIPKGQLLDSTIVAANKVKRRHDYAELNHVDDEELKRRGIKRIEPNPTCQSVDCEPAHYIQEEVQQCRRPFIAEETRPQTGPAEAASGAGGLADVC